MFVSTEYGINSTVQGICTYVLVQYTVAYIFGMVKFRLISFIRAHQYCHCYIWWMLCDYRRRNKQANSLINFHMYDRPWHSKKNNTKTKVDATLERANGVCSGLNFAPNTSICISAKYHCTWYLLCISLILVSLWPLWPGCWHLLWLPLTSPPQFTWYILVLQLFGVNWVARLFCLHRIYSNIGLHSHCPLCRVT